VDGTLFGGAPQGYGENGAMRLIVSYPAEPVPQNRMAAFVASDAPPARVHKKRGGP
jgi:hypothetical protein